MFAYRHFYDLRPTAGTALRVIVDIASIWVGFAVAWIIVLGGQTAALTAQLDVLIPLAACISVLCFVVYADAGLYSISQSTALREKLGRVFLVNLVFFAIVAAIWMLVTQFGALAIGSAATVAGLLAAAYAVSAILVSLARVSSYVLRTDDVGGGSISANEHRADENRVLVVGGGGYIGSILVERLLDQGKQVLVLDAMHFGEDPLSRVIDRPNLTIIREDFRHVEALTRAMEGVGSVIHLGGLVGDPACAVDPDLTIDMNLTATKLVGEIAKACGVKRFIFASSCSVYGACDEVVDERSSFNPQSLYARTKVASEAVLMPLNDDNFAVTCLRFATVYGISGRIRFDLVVNLLCAKAVRDGQITVFGPDQWRPFVHVEDVARAIDTTLQAPVDVVAGDVFNVGSDSQNYTLGQAAEMINRQVPSAEIIVDETFTDTRNYRVSFEKIREQLGFEPAWSLERGISQVVGIVRSNRVGHYSLPTYSNVLRLKERGPKSFATFQITGWEDEVMNGANVAADRQGNQSTAA